MSKRALIRYTTTPIASSQAAVYALSGRLTGDNDSYALLDAITEVIEAGTRHIVLDLAALEFSNSSGLGIIASIYNLVQGKGGKLVIVGAGERVRLAMDIIRLWALVEKAPNVEEALLKLPDA